MSNGLIYELVLFGAMRELWLSVSSIMGVMGCALSIFKTNPYAKGKKEWRIEIKKLGENINFHFSTKSLKFDQTS